MLKFKFWKLLMAVTEENMGVHEENAQ